MLEPIMRNNDLPAQRKRNACIGLMIIAVTAILVAGCATAQSSRQSKSNGPFSSKYVAHLKESEIVVVNQSSKTITLKLTGSTSQSLSISPNSKKSVAIPSGNYNYRASAPGVTPALGTNLFEKHHRYTWSFSIRTGTY